MYQAVLATSSQLVEQSIVFNSFIHRFVMIGGVMVILGIFIVLIILSGMSLLSPQSWLTAIFVSLIVLTIIAFFVSIVG